MTPRSYSLFLYFLGHGPKNSNLIAWIIPHSHFFCKTFSGDLLGYLSIRARIIFQKCSFSIIFRNSVLRSISYNPLRGLWRGRKFLISLHYRTSYKDTYFCHNSQGIFCLFTYITHGFVFFFLLFYLIPNHIRGPTYTFPFHKLMHLDKVLLLHSIA